MFIIIFKFRIDYSMLYQVAIVVIIPKMRLILNYSIHLNRQFEFSLMLASISSKSFFILMFNVELNL